MKPVLLSLLTQEDFVDDDRDADFGTLYTTTFISEMNSCSPGVIFCRRLRLDGMTLTVL